MLELLYACFRRDRARRRRLAEWLAKSPKEWNARQQLDLVQRRAQELGMPIGLYFDLALGADRGGAEVWSDRESYATDASIGAIWLARSAYLRGN